MVASRRSTISVLSLGRITCVSGSTIEFKHARSLFGKHHAREKQSSKVKAFGLDSEKKGFQNLLPNLVQPGAIQVTRRAAGTHSAGIWSSIAIVDLLVILSRR